VAYKGLNLQEIQEYNKQLIEIYQQFAYSVAVTRRLRACTSPNLVAPLCIQFSIFTLW
jgi:hypothetical protein